MAARKNRSKPKPQADTPANAAGVLRVERVPVDQINPAPDNPRHALRPGDPEWDKLKDSLNAFGYAESITWNRQTGHLVGGHQRFAILVQEHAITEVDVVVVDLPHAQEKALNVALNKIDGRWDTQRLAELMAEIQDDDAIDEALTGFDAEEINGLIESALAEADGPSDDDDHTAPKNKPVNDLYAVMVQCSSEAEQADLYERMTQAGHKCRLMMI
ncbi:MAG: ParB N-terminal domain-containing protein [Planctomycetota bacterium]